MFIEEKFYNLKCDRCGAILNEDEWQGCEQFCEDSAHGWVKLDDGRHICPSCFLLEDDDSITISGTKELPVEVVEPLDWGYMGS